MTSEKFVLKPCNKNTVELWFRCVENNTGHTYGNLLGNSQFLILLDGKSMSPKNNDQKNNSEFVLSICIPTYNRGDLLRNTLESIVVQTAFSDSDDVEIVISDNCSDDNTEAVVAVFAKAFPSKIKYRKNDRNVGAEINLELALSLSTGVLAKLHNDDLLIRNGSLDRIIKVVKATEAEKPIIFMTNGNRCNGNVIEVCDDLNQYMTSVSFFCTWIGGFCIWREDFKAITEFSRSAWSRIPHTDVLLRLLAAGRRAIVLKDVYFLGQNVKKGGYNIAEVFGRNYLELLKPYLISGKLDDRVFKVLKKEILLMHVIPYYFDKQNMYSKTGFFKHLEDYWNEDYFQDAIERLILN